MLTCYESGCCQLSKCCSDARCYVNNTLLDVILSSKPQLYSKSLSTDSDGISDHNLVTAVRLCDGSRKTPDLKFYRDMKQFNKDKFVNDLLKVPWSLIETFDDVNDMWSTWKHLFMDVVNNHAPIKKKQRRQKHNISWMNTQIVNLIRDWDYFRHASLSRNRSLDEKVSFQTTYRHLRNFIKREIHHAKV